MGQSVEEPGRRNLMALEREKPLEFNTAVGMTIQGVHLR